MCTHTPQLVGAHSRQDLPTISVLAFDVIAASRHRVRRARRLGEREAGAVRLRTYGRIFSLGKFVPRLEPAHGKQRTQRARRDAYG